MMRGWVEFARGVVTGFLLVTTLLGPVADVARDMVHSAAAPGVVYVESVEVVR